MEWQDSQGKKCNSCDKKRKFPTHSSPVAKKKFFAGYQKNPTHTQETELQEQIQFKKHQIQQEMTLWENKIQELKCKYNEAHKEFLETKARWEYALRSSNITHQKRCELVSCLKFLEQSFSQFQTGFSNCQMQCLKAIQLLQKEIILLESSNHG